MIRIEPITTYLMLSKTLIAWLIIYFFIPAQVIRFDAEADKLLDRFFISLIHLSFWTIIIVHTLVFLRLYETFSLFFCYAVLFLTVIWTRGKSRREFMDALGMRFVVYLLDASDNTEQLSQSLRNMGSRFKAFVLRIAQQARNLILSPFQGILPLMVLAAAMYLRFRWGLFHSTYTQSDPYEFLAWVKYLSINEIYYDGIYPQGFSTLLSPLQKLFFIDPYWAIRFIGPFLGSVLVLAVYYLVTRLTRSYQASLIALTLMGLTLNPLVYTVFARQTAALPMECGAIFAFCGIYFLQLYLTTAKRKYLFIFLECVAVSAFVHPYAALCLAIWTIVQSGIYLAMQRRAFLTLLRLAGFSMLAVLVGFLPLGIGFLKGYKFFVAADFVQSNLKLETNFQDGIIAWLQSLLQQETAFNIFLVFLIAMIILLSLPSMREWRLSFLTITLTSLTTYLLYRGSDIGLPQLMHPFRTSVFLWPLAFCVISLGFAGIEILLHNRSSVPQNLVRGAALLISLSLIFLNPPLTAEGRTYEYEAAANNYLKIKQEFTALDWTIIGPPEQYQQALGYGWHSDILRFVQEHSEEELANPQYKMPIPTHDIFFYTEKVPLFYSKAVTEEDARLVLEPEEGDPYSQYYLDGEQRRIMQAKAIQLAEAYRRSHSGVTIYYEDEALRIYRFHHEPPKSVAGGIQ